MQRSVSPGFTLFTVLNLSALTSMSKPRFYFPAPLQPHQHFELPEPVAHYALRVLRLKNDAEIVLFDGRGGEYPAHLKSEGRHATAITAAHNPREAELAGQINLIQALATADKMDWIIEKAVELGASRVIPVAAQRSVLHLRGERLEKRLQHWQRVVQSASEQCGRNRLLIVERPRTTEQFLEQLEPGPANLTLLCHPEYGIALDLAIRNFNDVIKSTEGARAPVLNLMIGPEGGWSEPELAQAHHRGVNAIQFGPRILRTETAGLALIAASTALLGWNSP